MKQQTTIEVTLYEQEDGTQSVSVGYSEDLKTAALVGALYMAADAVMNPPKPKPQPVVF